MMAVVEYNPYKPLIPKHADKIISCNFPAGKITDPKRHNEKKSQPMQAEVL